MLQTASLQRHESRFRRREKGGEYDTHDEQDEIDYLT
jgi:hypothetical protein